MKISASIYSGKDKQLTELVKELDLYGTDYFHIDCLDEPVVFDDIEMIRKISITPVDLHLITDRPEHYFPLIEKHRIEKVTFQYENLPAETKFPKFQNSDLGIAITSETSLDVFDNFSNHCSFILLMTTTPGKSGGTFNRENFRKIRNFRNRYPKKAIHVDGGVNEEISFILRTMGVDVVVSGSYLVNAPSVNAAMLTLRHNQTASRYKISDFMIGPENTPVINGSNITLEKILRSIEDFNQGFTIVSGDDNKLRGIVTNADVRRGLLKNLENLNHFDLNDYLNTNPAFINKNRTISEMLKLIKSHKNPLLYIPVVNDDHEVAGCVTFNNLIKGES